MPGNRVRFAPSPTGFLHVGSARTALFNWFVARQDPDGVFILRVEDTDEDRNREEWVEAITHAMDWLRMHPDEGPYRQSHYAADHQAALTALASARRLYSCHCTAEDVAARKPPGAPPGYDRHCRDLNLEHGPTSVWRFAVPRDGTTVVRDLIRGDVEFANDLIDDFVVARPNGAVLFALANAVDDRRDRVTHVIRGDEHLPNTPKQILLWEALSEIGGDDVALPVYAHLPLLVNEQRKKLSKRRDPVAVELYRDLGYLSEAFVNYLSLLGWSPRGEEEKVDLATCISQFRLADVSHSPAFFDTKKMAHLNGTYIRELTVAEFINRCRPWVSPWSAPWAPAERPPPWTAEQFNESVFAAIAPLVQERVSLLSDVPEMIDFLFLPLPIMDESAVEKVLRRDDTARRVIDGVAAAYGTVPWETQNLHEALVAVGDSLGLVLRKAQAPIRVAVTGRTVGPPLFESVHLLGREVTLSRLASARALVG